jgi:GMP synthase-like glutamine amidotransferase
MRVLLIQHDAQSPAGLVGEAIEANGGTLEVLHPCAGDALPADASGYDALLMTGGAMSANDGDVYPHYPQMFNLIRDFVVRDRAIMGICLGAQLLAKALGAKVRPMGFTEFAFMPILPTEAATTDPLLHDLGEGAHFMQYHEDTFAVPEGAVLLAGNEVCANQAYRYGTRHYGFQFHLEATAETARIWARLPDTPDVYRQGDPISRLEADLATHYADASARAEDITRRWMALAAGGDQMKERAVA